MTSDESKAMGTLPATGNTLAMKEEGTVTDVELPVAFASTLLSASARTEENDELKQRCEVTEMDDDAIVTAFSPLEQQTRTHNDTTNASDSARLRHTGTVLVLFLLCERVSARHVR